MTGASWFLYHNFRQLITQTESVPHTPIFHKTIELRTKTLPAYTIHVHHRSQNYDTLSQNFDSRESKL